MASGEIHAVIFKHSKYIYLNLLSIFVNVLLILYLLFMLQSKRLVQGFKLNSSNYVCVSERDVISVLLNIWDSCHLALKVPFKAFFQFSKIERSFLLNGGGRYLTRTRCHIILETTKKSNDINNYSIF